MLTVSEEVGAESEGTEEQENRQVALDEKESDRRIQQERSGPKDIAVQNMQEPGGQEDTAAQEMAALVLQLKDKVKSLINMGQYQAASTVIEQLKVYLPADTELLELQERCKSHLG